MIPRWHSKFPFLLLSGFCALFAAPVESRAESVFDSITKEVQEVFDHASPSIIRIAAITGVSPLAGTGFFIDDQGTILTAYDVVRDAPKAWVEYKGEKLEAKILGRDWRSGVAVLKIDRKGMPFLKFGDSDKVKVASGLISVAYPYNLPLTPNFGFVTGMDVRYLNRYFATTHIRASVPVSPGQIGGPLLNSSGDVVGLLVLGIQDGKELYCLPIKSAGRAIDDIRKLGFVKHAWVGVGVVEGQPRNGEGGERPVLVSHFYEGTPAVNSGVHRDDRVVRINGREIKRPADILDASYFARSGEKIPVTVIRDGKEMTFQVEMAERPDSSPLVDHKIVTDGPEGMNIPFVVPPTVPDSKDQPIRVNSQQ